MSIIPGSKPLSSRLRFLLVPAVLLGFSLGGFAQAEKYANISNFPDASILSYLQKAYPNDKLNYYDVKLNGKMQHVKNYYDYISFRCVLLDSQVVKSSAPATEPLRSGTADTALMRRILEDTTGKLRDSLYRAREIDSLKKVSEDSLAKAAATKPDTALGLQANTTNQLASVLGAQNDIHLSENNVLSKRQVDSTWVLADTLISARRGITHPTENAVPTSTAPPASPQTETAPVASSYVVTADTIFMINFGANAEHRPSMMWIYHSKDPSTHIVVGAGEFKDEMLMLQSFCDGLGLKLTPFQVEIWDLFVKSHQSAMYTPVYDHEAHYQSAPPQADGTAAPTQ